MQVHTVYIHQSLNFRSISGISNHRKGCKLGTNGQCGNTRAFLVEELPVDLKRQKLLVTNLAPRTQLPQEKDMYRLASENLQTFPVP